MRSFETAGTENKTSKRDQRSAGISPELTEFLHMLNALETRNLASETAHSPPTQESLPKG